MARLGFPDWWADAALSGEGAPSGSSGTCRTHLAHADADVQAALAPIDNVEAEIHLQ
ncbi:MAG: hypothetical protein ACTHLK_17970 [Brucella intermedia]